MKKATDMPVKADNEKEGKMLNATDVLMAMNEEYDVFKEMIIEKMVLKPNMRLLEAVKIVTPVINKCNEYNQAVRVYVDTKDSTEMDKKHKELINSLDELKANN